MDTFGDSTEPLQLRNVDGDPHGRNFSGVFRPMGRRTTFRKTSAGLDNLQGLPLLVIRHLAFEKERDCRTIHVVVQAEYAAWLNGNLAHAQGTPFRGIELGGEIQ
jgi:hypothetical protein